MGAGSFLPTLRMDFQRLFVTLALGPVTSLWIRFSWLSNGLGFSLIFILVHVRVFSPWAGSRRATLLAIQCLSRAIRPGGDFFV